jgi:transcriptional regulator with XRE-family HTH domain
MLTPFGKAIRRCRDASNITLKAMADQLGVSSSYLSAIEHGRQQPSPVVVDLTSELFAEDPLARSDWLRLAQALPTQVQLDLTGADELEREVYLGIGRYFPQLPQNEKEEIRQFIRERVRRLELSY